MKQKVAIVCALTMVLSIFLGCSKDPAEEMGDFLRDKVKLDRGQVETIVKKFEKLPKAQQEKELAEAKAEFAMDGHDFRDKMKKAAR